jgi:hypothetical protein
LAFFLAMAAAPLAAQQTDAMAKDQDAMAKDTGAMMDSKGAMHDDHGMAMAPHGTFAGAQGHKARGSYEIATAGGKTQLKLGSDFSVEKGPDVYVVLSPGDRVPAKGAVYLGKLTRFSGAATFDVPRHRLVQVHPCRALV